MATIGVDCEVIIDGTGYFVKPGSYLIKWPRVRKATIRADNNESYVDLGPGKREWVMTILCLNELQGYDGIQVANDGQQFRDALYTSYSKVAQTINFTDPAGTVIAVRFDGYIEHILDLHGQIIAVAAGGSAAKSTYEVGIVLVEG